MDKSDCIRCLEKILDQTKQLTATIIELEEAKEHLKNLRTKPLVAKSNFDTTKKDAFIEERIGIAPKAPKGAIKLAVPLYISKKIYEKEYAKYVTSYKKSEQEYYAEFKDVREKLESEEKSALAYKIQFAEENVSNANEAYQTAKAALSANGIISNKLKDADIIQTLIEYFQNQRVDTIKEAVNLYYEEEHRKRLEAFAKEQVRLTTEATKQARCAADSAEEAIRRVDEAMRKAEEAYDRANEAYSEAQNAYWEATSNND